MQSSTVSPTPPEPSEGELSALLSDLRTAERSIASAVLRAGQLAGSGVAERVEGGTLDWVISMACRWTGTDARVLVGAAQTLEHLPTVRRLFVDGNVSWGQVRHGPRRLRLVHGLSGSDGDPASPSGSPPRGRLRGRAPALAPVSA